jgi:hypothetical protein
MKMSCVEPGRLETTLALFVQLGQMSDRTDGHETSPPPSIHLFVYVETDHVTSQVRSEKHHESTFKAYSASSTNAVRRDGAS